MGRFESRAIFGDDNENDTDSRYPSAWFVIPIVGAIALACLFMLLRYRRKKLLRTLTSYRNIALRQDIETMGPPQHRPLNLNRPWNRTNMPPAPNGAATAGPGPVASSHNEGLNEFGEAPPAYTARQKQQSAMVEEIELGHMGRPQVDVALPPTAATTGPAHGSPPSYIEAQQGSIASSPGPTNSTQDGPDRPPPAVLGPR